MTTTSAGKLVRFILSDYFCATYRQTADKMSNLPFADPIASFAAYTRGSGTNSVGNIRPSINLSLPDESELDDLSAGALINFAMAHKFVPRLPDVLSIVICNNVTQNDERITNSFIMRQLQKLRGWDYALNKMNETAVLKTLILAMDRFTAKHKILAPLPQNYFKSMENLRSNNIQVVFIGQDPYPSCDKNQQLLRQVNTMSHWEVEKLVGVGYDKWELCQPTDWPPYVQCSRSDDTSPRVKIGAIPYAIGRSFAYPSVCTTVPGSFENLKTCVINSGYLRPEMDPELLNWERQGVFMMNACPILAEGSSKNPNLWSAFTAAILESVAMQNPYCVFVMLGNSAKSFQKTILKASSNACILMTSHPSKRVTGSAPFTSSQIFLKINQFRKSISESRAPNDLNIPNLPPIKW